MESSHEGLVLSGKSSDLKKETRKAEKEGFLEGISEEVTEAFAQLSPLLKEEIKKRFVTSVLSSSNHPDGMFREGNLADLVRWIEEERRKNYHYTREEVAVEDEIRQQEIFWGAFYELLRTMDIRSLVRRENGKEALREFMDVLWNNRGKESKDMRIDQTDEEEWKRLGQELKTAQADINNLHQRLVQLRTKKKLNVHTEKEMQQLDKKLLDTYGLYLHKLATSPFRLESDSFVKYSQRPELASAKRYQLAKERYQELSATMRENSPKHRWFETLAYVIEYQSADDFAVLFLEQVESRFRTFRGVEKESMTKVQEVVEEWYTAHEDEPAIHQHKTLEEAEKKRKLEQFFDRFKVLVDSYRRRQKAGDDAKILEATLPDILVVLHLLKKFGS